MSELLDTSVILSAHERQDRNAMKTLQEFASKVGLGSLFVLGELEHGVASATRQRSGARKRTLRWYQLTHDMPAYESHILARLFGQVSATAGKKMIRAGQNDRWIVAEALYRDRELLTCDDPMRRLAKACGVQSRLIKQDDHSTGQTRPGWCA